MVGKCSKQSVVGKRASHTEAMLRAEVLSFGTNS